MSTLRIESVAVRKGDRSDRIARPGLHHSRSLAQDGYFTLPRVEIVWRTRDAQYIHTRFRRYPVAVHIDTGLGRGGCTPT
jgi:hypothetical protein